MDHPGPESLSDDEIMYTKIIHVFIINFFINMYKMFLNYN
jgi:hypothetical protein